MAAFPVGFLRQVLVVQVLWVLAAVVALVVEVQCVALMVICLVDVVCGLWPTGSHLALGCVPGPVVVGVVGLLGSSNVNVCNSEDKSYKKQPNATNVLFGASANALAVGPCYGICLYCSEFISSLLQGLPSAS